VRASATDVAVRLPRRQARGGHRATVSRHGDRKAGRSHVCTRRSRRRSRAYYQEIGRAGRDGAPCVPCFCPRASNVKTHEFFLERDYPAHEVLARVEKASPRGGSSVGGRRGARGPSLPVFEKALEKLWVHGGAFVGPDDTVVTPHRMAPCLRIGSAPTSVNAFQDAPLHGKSACRMLSSSDTSVTRTTGAPCGSCDVARPRGVHRAELSGSEARQRRAPLAAILTRLRERDGPPSARSIAIVRRRRYRPNTLEARARGASPSDPRVSDRGRRVREGWRNHRLPAGLSRVPRALSGQTGGIRMVVVPNGRQQRGVRGRREDKSGSQPYRSRPRRREQGCRGGGTTGRESAPQMRPMRAATRAWRTTEAKKRRACPRFGS